MWELSGQDSYVGNFSGLTIKKLSDFFQIFCNIFIILSFKEMSSYTIFK